MRSPLHAWVNNPEHYYRSVTAHGTVMAYVLPTLVAMGFGYAIVELALKRPLIGLRWAWGGFWLVVVGTTMAAVTMAAGKASVLYTFYPPMIASPCADDCKPLHIATRKSAKFSALCSTHHCRHLATAWLNR